MAARRTIAWRRLSQGRSNASGSDRVIAAAWPGPCRVPPLDNGRGLVLDEHTNRFVCNNRPVGFAPKEAAVTRDELHQFLAMWDVETGKTLRMLDALPADKYDFRPDPGGRSLGELAWHLAEGDAYLSATVANGKFDPTVKVPGLERPRTIDALAPGYQRIHRDAVGRVESLSDAQLNATIPFIGGAPTSVSELLWVWLLMANVHHRGQLSLMCRLAGGVVPGMYGPNREEMAAMRAKASSVAT